MVAVGLWGAVLRAPAIWVLPIAFPLIMTVGAVLGILDFPASLIAGILWQGTGPWSGLGPRAPFLFGAGMALLAAALLHFWLPAVRRDLHNQNGL